MSWLNHKNPTLKSSLIYNSIGLTIYLASQWSLSILVVPLGGLANAGWFALAQSISGTFHSIALFGMRNYQISDIDGRFGDSVYITSRAMTSLLSLILCAGLIATRTYPMELAACILVFMLFRITEAFVDVMHGIDQKFGRLDIVAISFIVRGLAASGVFVVVLYLTQNLLLAISGMAFASFMSIVVFDIPLLRKMTRFSFRPKQLKKHMVITVNLLKQCIPLMLYSSFFMALQMYVRMLLQQRAGDTTLGIFSSVTTPAVVIQVAATFLYTPLIPLMANYWKSDNQHNFRKSLTRTILMITLIGSIAVAVSVTAGKHALILLYGNIIGSHTALLHPAVVTASLIALVYYLNAILIIIRDMKGLIASNLIGCTAGILVSHFFIPKFGAAGANYSLLLAMFLLSLMLLLRISLMIHKRKAMEKFNVLPE